MARPIAAITTIPRPAENSLDLNLAIHSAAKQLAALRVAPIVGEPDKSDAQELISALLTVARIVDPLVQRFGEHARSNFGRVDLALFADQLRDALEGNAVFAIGEAAELMIADRAEGAADARREFFRGLVSDDRWSDYPVAAE